MKPDNRPRVARIRRVLVRDSGRQNDSVAPPHPQLRPSNAHAALSIEAKYQDVLRAARRPVGVMPARLNQFAGRISIFSKLAVVV